MHAYLGAAAIADRQATLAQNWRADPDLLTGLDQLFRGAALGDPRIVVAPVTAAHTGRALDDGAAPVQLRVLGTRRPTVGTARSQVVADLVRYVIDTLDGGALLTPREGGPSRPVRPGDIAVVVDTNAQLDLVHTALLAAGVPSVQRTTSSVFRTPAGTEWVILLEALEQPHRVMRVRRLAITSFVGWDATELDTRDLDRLHLRLRHWLALFEERGIAALLTAVSRDERLAARLLGQLDGERRLTDLRHVGEALHAAATAGRLGLTAKLEWLRRRVQESDRDTTVERSRRLDSDAAAVQVATAWASKGLEFPIVLVPFEWDRFMREEAVPLFHDENGRRVRDVGGPDGPRFAAHRGRDRAEQLGEDLRLLYVALTRAQARVTAWWAPSARNTECSPLHRLLFAAEPAAAVPERAAVPEPAAAFARLAGYALDGCLSVSEIAPREPVRWSGTTARPAGLSVALLGRSVDATWRRTSYSALTSAAHEAAVGSEPEVGEKDDEPADRRIRRRGDDALRAVPSPMAALPGGTAFGTLVHAVLERVDPTTPDLAAELRSHAAAQLARFGPGRGRRGRAGTGAAAAVATPLGPLADGLPLADIAPGRPAHRARLRAAAGGGDRPRRRPARRPRAACCAPTCPPATRSPATPTLLDDPLRRRRRLRGYLTGSIDAVLRVARAAYLVVDYKTNRLGPPDEPLTAWHYRAGGDGGRDARRPLPAAGAAVRVALHRYLRWRLPGYDPARHLGGVLYLFLRGMCGPDDAARRRRNRARRVRVAAAGRAGRRAVGPARCGRGRADERSSRPRRPTAARAPARPGCWRSSTGRGARPADVHVAAAARRDSAGETDERVLLAAALTVRGTRHGSVVIDLAHRRRHDHPGRRRRRAGRRSVELPWPEPADWAAACAASPLVTGAAGGPPLRMVGSSLWLDRYWRQEEQVAATCWRARADAAGRRRPGAAAADLGRLFAAADDQRSSGRAAAQSPAGRVHRRRPGHRQDHHRRAAARVAAPAAGPEPCASRWPRPPARRPPGLRRRCTPRARAGAVRPTGSGSPRCPRRRCTGCWAGGPARRAGSGTTARNRLPLRRGGGRRELDGVADADGPAARGARAGHPAGAGRRPRPARVGGGRCRARRPGRQRAAARLGGPAAHRPPVRRGGPIAELAGLVRAGRGDDALALLRSGPDELVFAEIDDEQAVPADVLASVEQAVVAHESALIAAARAGEVGAALDALDAHRLLCAHRTGPRGVAHWTSLAERWLPAPRTPRLDGRYPGEPLLVTANDYEAGVYNGDTGSWWPRATNSRPRSGAAASRRCCRLSGSARCDPARDDVHRAQGSQFGAVTVLLPLAGLPVGHPADVLHRDHPRGVAGAPRRLGGRGAGLRRSPDRPCHRAAGPAHRSARAGLSSDEPDPGSGRAGDKPSVTQTVVDRPPLSDG